jgi:hypothetical protein
MWVFYPDITAAASITRVKQTSSKPAESVAARKTASEHLLLQIRVAFLISHAKLDR